MKLIAGNWKMNTNAREAEGLAQAIAVQASAIQNAELLVCPPSLWLECVKDSIQDQPVSLGAQDCHEEVSGAYTGDISAEMIANIGAQYVILGHSERRHGRHKENDDLIRMKSEAALNAGLKVILCVGETLEERQAGKAEDVVKHQLDGCLTGQSDALNTVIAYEPVWAIGTGEVATPEDIETMHQALRDYLTNHHTKLSEARLLYGGSVKPDNAQSVLATPNVDGVLVGGASLKADSFIQIAQSAK